MFEVFSKNFSGMSDTEHLKILLDSCLMEFLVQSLVANNLGQFQSLDCMTNQTLC